MKRANEDADNGNVHSEFRATFIGHCGRRAGRNEVLSRRGEVISRKKSR